MNQQPWSKLTRYASEIIFCFRDKSGSETLNEGLKFYQIYLITVIEPFLTTELFFVII